jgi:hypothetical protein
MILLGFRRIGGVGESIVVMRKDLESNRPISDLVLWLLGAALAIVLFLVVKTPLWTVLLLAGLSATLLHPVTQIPWARANRPRQIGASGLMVFLFVCFGFMVWPNAPGNAAGAPKGAFIALMDLLFTLLKERWTQNVLCVLAGMLLLKSFQMLARRAVISRKRRVSVSTGTKGFLDYKMQAEVGMQRLSPKLTEITKIMSDVGFSIGKHSGKVQDASTSPARVQLEVVRKTAISLEGFSKQLDKKCKDLEEIGNSLAEGIEEWMKWVSTQPDGWMVKQGLEGLLRTFVDTLAETLKQTNSYIAMLQLTRGVSRDWNEALDSHLRSIARVRDVSGRIRDSCMNCLHLFETIQPPQ